MPCELWFSDNLRDWVYFLQASFSWSSSDIIAWWLSILFPFIIIGLNFSFSYFTLSIFYLFLSILILRLLFSNHPYANKISFHWNNDVVFYWTGTKRWGKEGGGKYATCSLLNIKQDNKEANSFLIFCVWETIGLATHLYQVAFVCRALQKDDWPMSPFPRRQDTWEKRPTHAEGAKKKKNSSEGKNSMNVRKWWYQGHMHCEWMIDKNKKTFRRRWV